MYCYICDKEIDIDNANFSALHIKKFHNMSIKDYYDKYMKKDEEGICKYCTNQTTFKGITKGYTSFCSRECASNGSRDKAKKTCIKKYGVDSYSKTSEHRDLVSDRNKSEDIRKRQKEGIQKAYSDPKRKESILNKRKKTNQSKYGTDHASQCIKVKEQTAKSNIEKYGVVSTALLPEVIEKRNKTIQEKYGTVHTTQHSSVINKISKTKRSKYYDTLINKLKLKKITLLSTYNEFVDGIYSFKCNNCNNTFNTKESNAHAITCKKCGKTRSKYENEIVDWLNSYGVTNIELNNKYYENGKRKFELDIYLPDYNIAIEYCGLYFHSDFFRSRSYHNDKYTYFKNMGIKVIQVFESEWFNKNEIVKSIILNNLNITNNRIYARKCTIEEISSKEYRNFLDENHLQGFVSSKLKYGLKKDNQLLAVCGVSKSRYSKHETHELTRFCVKRDHLIIGGFSKLMKFIMKQDEIKSLISYCDLRYFDSHAYESFGFKYSHTTQPNYFYFKNNSTVLESRIKYQKHKLEKILPIYDHNKTEYENMIDNKYFRIFDAGNSVWIYNK